MTPSTATRIVTALLTSEALKAAILRGGEMTDIVHVESIKSVTESSTGRMVVDCRLSTWGEQNAPATVYLGIDEAGLLVANW